MKLLSTCIFITVMTITACGSDREVSKEGNASQEIETIHNNDDLFAFTQPGSDVLFQMNFNAENIQRKKDNLKSLETPVWEDPIKILNNTCGGVSLERYKPIYLVSPDGARLGQIDESWKPNWSPSGDLVALACGRDNDNHVIVVSDTEHQGSSKGWSRTEKGYLSDRMEIYVLAPDGSNIMQLTGNESSDWLPRWFPKDKALENYEEIKSTFFLETAQWPDMLLVESNRDGNSEIYLHVTYGTDSWRITKNESNEQSPAWSRDGNGIAFASDVRIKDFGISLLGAFMKSIENTSQIGRPVPWE